MIDWFPDMINDWLIDYQTIWMIDWLNDWLTDWLIDLIDWLIDWLIGRTISWLIDRYKGRLHASWGGGGSTEGIKIKGRREETSQNKETKKIFGKGERFV